jgi:hypothetical protein
MPAVRRWQAIAGMALLQACSVTQPVAVISSSGQVLRGTATSEMSGGTFEVTDGKLTCAGNYDVSGGLTLSAPVKCNDGRTGLAIIQRDRGGMTGSGRVRLSDGTDADLVFGPAARAF